MHAQDPAAQPDDAGATGVGQHEQAKMVDMSSSTIAVDGLNLDPVPPADLGHHRAQDYQSLLLHCAAIKLLLEKPALANRALATLDRWRQTTSPCSHSLLDEWQDILIKQDWHRAVAEDERGSELRQASPLGAVLPEAARLAVLAKAQALVRAERARATGG